MGFALSTLHSFFNFGRCWKILFGYNTASSRVLAFADDCSCHIGKQDCCLCCFLFYQLHSDETTDMCTTLQHTLCKQTGIYRTYTTRTRYKQTDYHFTTTAFKLMSKDKDRPEDRQGAVYKIKCCDCQASYIGETGRNLSPRA